MAGAAQMVINQTWLSELLYSFEGTEIIHGEIHALNATGVSLDSRTLEPGDIFVAISGSSSRGAEYALDAVKKGAAAIVTGKGQGLAVTKATGRVVPVLEVKSPRRAAARLACAFQGYPCHEFDLVGITGTNGKTTITFLLESILNYAGKYPGVIGTVDCRLGLWSQQTGLTTPDPVTLQKLLRKMADSGAGSVLLEVSSHALDQSRVEGCRFKIAIFTNLTRDHLDYHGDMEEYYRAKSRLFKEYRPEFSVINIDDPYGQRLYESLEGTALTYGFTKSADVHPVDYTVDISGLRALIRTPLGSLEIGSELIGRHNLSNILAAICASVCLNIEPYTIKKGISNLRSIPGRLEKVAAPRGITGLVDYAHTPDALEHVLFELKGLISGRLICVAGCGGNRDQGKRPLMGKIAAMNADLAIFTSDNPRDEDPVTIIEQMKEGLSGREELLKKVKVIPDRRKAITWAASIARPGDCVLVAGKGHESYQQIGQTKRPFDDKKVLSRSFNALTAQEVAEATNGTILEGTEDTLFTGVCTDSRSIEPGNLFVPIKGPNFDGHDFIAACAVDKASGSIVARERVEDAKSALTARGITDFCLIGVEDTERALGNLASYTCRKHQFKVFAITGSCGKTSTKEILHALLSQRWKSAKTIKNFNNLIGLPLSVFQADIDSEWLVLEMGMNSPGEIARLTEIASPAAALITNIRPAHLEGLGSIEAVAAEKISLFAGLDPDALAVINLDDPYIYGKSKELPCRRIGYSMDPDSGAEVVCLSWQPAVAGSIAHFSFEGNELDVKIPLLGKVAVNNALAASAAAYGLGLDLGEIKQGLADLKPMAGRLNLVSSGNGKKILDDAYNANPASMEAALDTLEHLALRDSRVAVLGDMYELGEQADALHAGVGAKAAEAGLAMLLAAGRYAEKIREGAEAAGLAPDRIKVFQDTELLLKWLETEGLKIIPKNATILVKGSRAMGLEKAVHLLTGLGSREDER